MTARLNNPPPPLAQRASEDALVLDRTLGYGRQERRRISWFKLILFAVIVVLIFAMASVFHK